MMRQSKESSASSEDRSQRLLTLLYERYSPQVYRLALRYGAGRTSWAEDITQDVFVGLAQQREHSLADVEELEGYFYCLTTRRCLNKLRHERLTRSGPVEWVLRALSPQPKSPEFRALVDAELRLVGKALNALPPKEQVAASMLFLDERSQREIAQVLGLSNGYVSKLLARATERLRASGLEVKDDA